MEEPRTNAKRTMVLFDDYEMKGYRGTFSKGYSTGRERKGASSTVNRALDPSNPDETGIPWTRIPGCTNE